MFARLMTARHRKAAAEKLFAALNEAARQPHLFGDQLFSDDPDGRFEAIALMATPMFHRLAGRGDQADELSQAVFDQLFRAFDQALRELGVGDLKVGPRIRKMAESFYGRLHAYRGPLAAGDTEALAAAIARNGLRGQLGSLAGGTAAPVCAAAGDLASAALRYAEQLANVPDEKLFKGET